MKNMLSNNNTRAALVAGGNVKPSTDSAIIARGQTFSKEESRQKAIALRRMEMNKKPVVTKQSGYTIIELLLVLIALAVIGGIGTMLYVVIHFIAKLW